MCVAVPGKLIEINNNIGKVDFSGNLVNVELGLVRAKVGDFLLVHAGCAIEVLSNESAQELLDLFKELEEVLDE